MTAFLLTPHTSTSPLRWYGLADTIDIGTALFNGGVIYGDAVGVTTEGTGTGGLADGNDRIVMTGAGIGTASTGASIYGAGGVDTIAISNIVSTAAGVLLADGGNGNDSILLSDGNHTGDSASLNGGNGQDTITVTTAVGALRLDGGAGQDTIFADAGSALTVLGGVVKTPLASLPLRLNILVALALT